VSQVDQHQLHHLDQGRELFQDPQVLEGFQDHKHELDHHDGLGQELLWVLLLVDDRDQDAYRDVKDVHPDHRVHLVWLRNNLNNANPLKLEDEVDEAVGHTDEQDEGEVIAVRIDSDPLLPPFEVWVVNVLV
jgi:hypothetical protein